MENEILRLLGMMFDLVEEAKAPALKPNQCIIDRNQMLDYIEDARNQIPPELQKAQDLLASRERFIAEAKRDVERMLHQAEQEAKTKVSESEILFAAREKATTMVARAEDRSKQLYQVTNEYAEDTLARTEEAIQMALEEVRQSRVRFRSVSGTKMQEQQSILQESAVTFEE